MLFGFMFEPESGIERKNVSAVIQADQNQHFNPMIIVISIIKGQRANRGTTRV